MSKLNEISRFIDSVYPSEKTLEDKLSSGVKLKIYYGIDPTSSRIHIGNAISLLVLRKFQEWGHKVILVFGDFTGLIGDPSGRDSKRKPMSEEELKKNAEEYNNQMEKLLDFDKNPPEVVFNSSWWKKVTSEQFLEIITNFTVSQMIERDLFQDRIRNQRPIALSEFLYPILQGYDSVALDTDIEIGATDQTFNMMVGREMLKISKNKEKVVITTPLLEGTDGRKMSKTFDNSIDISMEPSDMFDKIMYIKDELITKYFTLTTTINQEKIDEIEGSIKSGSSNPMEAKKKLAYEIVKLYNGDEEAKRSMNEFERVYQKGERTSKIDTVKKPKSILPKSYASLAALVGATPSVSAAINLAENKGLKFDGEVITEPKQIFKAPKGQGTIIDIGKRRSVKIVWEE
jgi:tyrosyl-tRNA synthetase